MKTFRKKRISIIIGLLAAMTVTSAQAATRYMGCMAQKPHS